MPVLLRLASSKMPALYYPNEGDRVSVLKGNGDYRIGTVTGRGHSRRFNVRYVDDGSEAWVSLFKDEWKYTSTDFIMPEAFLLLGRAANRWLRRSSRRRTPIHEAIKLCLKDTIFHLTIAMSQGMHMLPVRYGSGEVFSWALLYLKHGELVNTGSNYAHWKKGMTEEERATENEILLRLCKGFTSAIGAPNKMRLETHGAMALAVASTTLASFRSAERFQFLAELFGEELFF